MGCAAIERIGAGEPVAGAHRDAARDSLEKVALKVTGAEQSDLFRARCYV